MRNLRLSILSAAIFFTFSAFAQNNLVPNSSFELTDKKVKKGEGELLYASPWFSPSEETPADLYDKGNKNGYGIPENDRGYMDVDYGVKYAGFRAFSYRNSLPRTYLQVKLTKPLIAGKKYCVKFNIVLAKTSKYASNNIGLYISEKKPKESDFQNFAMTPQIRNTRNKIFSNQYGWDVICGVYVATGNERYIAIGNFTSDDDMDEKKDYLKMRKLKEFPQLQAIEAYYHIDEVSVINLEELEVCNCEDEDAGGNQMKVVYSTSESDDMDASAKDIMELKEVYYEKNSVTPSTASVVREVIDMLEANPAMNLEVVGHMDKLEDKSNLNDLSMERAKGIYDYLIKNGIDASRLSFKGVKSTQSVEDNGTQESLAKNRRVSFVVK